MRRIKLISCVAIALFVAACGQGGEGVSTDAGEHGVITLRRGNIAEPDTLDPHKSATKWESNIIGEMFIGLTTDDGAGRATKGAAEAHRVSPDGLTWTFELRGDMNWSDGVPVTASDFVFALQRILDPKTAAPYASLLYVIKNAEEVNRGERQPSELGVRAIDAKTLEIVLRNPAPYFLELARHKTMAPVPKHLVERFGDDWVKPQNIAANGPYRLAEWVPNTHVRMVKNAGFYDAANVQIDEVYFYPINDQAIELKRYQAGEIDIAASFPARQLAWAKETFGSEVHIHPETSSAYIQINTTRPPFTDMRVRRALSLAVDREALTDRILNAGQRPAYALVPPGMSNYSGAPQLDFKDTPMEERLSEARQLLAQVGFGPANPLKFTYRYMDSIDGRRLAVALQDMWRQIGCEVEILNSEAPVHYAALRTQDFDLASAGWAADYDDAENYLFLLQSSSGRMNYSKFKNERYDALMTQAARTLDLDERSRVLDQAEEIVLREQPLIPQYYIAYRALVRSYVKGWVDNSGDLHRARYLRIERSGDEPDHPIRLKSPATDRGAQGRN